MKKSEVERHRRRDELIAAEAAKNERTAPNIDLIAAHESLRRYADELRGSLSEHADELRGSLSEHADQLCDQIRDANGREVDDQQGENVN